MLRELMWIATTLVIEKKQEKVNKNVVTIKFLAKQNF